MIIVKISGGLGNQMFQYALCVALINKGYEVKIDKSKYEYYQIHNNYELDKVFGITALEASEKERLKYSYRHDNRLTSWLLKTPFKKKCIYIEKNMNFDENVFQNDNVYLSGYWQSEKYFKDIRDTILEVFKFPEVSSELVNLTNKIKNSKSVSLHVRRGDYLNHPLYKDICDLNYYKSAIDQMYEWFGNDLELFIFSNDVDWVKKNLKFKNMHIVKGNSGSKSFLDMHLMSLCKHNIISNSSFSWWGAWLNNNPEQRVISPSKWINNPKCLIEDIVPYEWYKV